MSTLRKLVPGRMFDMYAPAAGERCRVETDLRAYGRVNPTGYKKIAALLKDVADHGFQHVDETKCRNLGDNGYEFKEQSGLLRIYGFIDPLRQRIVILTHVTKKNPGRGKKSKEQNAQIDTAKRWYRAYLRNPLPLEED